MFIHVKECESTQSIALAELKSNLQASSVWVLADRMIKGRGRRGKTWECLEGNLFLSGAFRIPAELLTNGLTDKAAHWPFVSLLMAQALITALKENQGWNDRLFIKWPNDLWGYSLKGIAGKVGGILCELRANNMIVGLGLNIKSHPTDNHDYPTWDLEELLGRNCDKVQIAKSVSLEFEELFKTWLASPELTQKDLSKVLWTENMRGMRKATFTHNESDRELSAVGLTKDGALKVIYIDSGETFEVHDGEITLRSFKQSNISRVQGD